MHSWCLSLRKWSTTAGTSNQRLGKKFAKLYSTRRATNAPLVPNEQLRFIIGITGRECFQVKTCVR